MASYNRVILAGNLTRDPQLSYLPSQTPVVDFGLAINRYWTAQDGQRREETCFVDVRAYGKQAEVINHYMAKGRGILVEGRLQFQQWQAQDGTKRSKHIVITDNFQFLGGGPRDGSDADNAQVKPPVRTQSQRPAPSTTGTTMPEDADAPPPTGDDDIPF